MKNGQTLPWKPHTSVPGHLTLALLFCIYRCGRGKDPATTVSPDSKLMDVRGPGKSQEGLGTSCHRPGASEFLRPNMEKGVFLSHAEGKVDTEPLRKPDRGDCSSHNGVMGPGSPW